MKKVRLNLEVDELVKQIIIKKSQGQRQNMTQYIQQLVLKDRRKPII